MPLGSGFLLGGGCDRVLRAEIRASLLVAMAARLSLGSLLRHKSMFLRTQIGRPALVTRGASARVGFLLRR